MATCFGTICMYYAMVALTREKPRNRRKFGSK